MDDKLYLIIDFANIRIELKISVQNLIVFKFLGMGLYFAHIANILPNFASCQAISEGGRGRKI